VEVGHKPNFNFEPKAKEQKEPVTAGSDKK
jgi:hypothetical protein